MEDFFLVDTHFCTQGIIVVGHFFGDYNDSQFITPPPQSLREAFSLLPELLQQICGNVHIPNDDGRALMEHVLNKNKLYGASDAAFKKRRASHAWISSSGEVDDISDNDLHISGQGPVDGHTVEMSSGQGEIH